MSYTSKEWVTGDDISINDLNNIEEGINIAANPFVVILTPTNEDFSGTMNKTSNEISSAIQDGKTILFEVTGFPGFDEVLIPAAWYTLATDHPRYAACATLVDITTDLQIIIVTSEAENSTDYFTSIYTLQPMLYE